MSRSSCHKLMISWLQCTLSDGLLQVAKARLDAAIAAGYDPDAEFRSMLGRLMTDDELEGAEVDEDRQKPEAQKQPQSTTPDLDTDFMEQLTEEERQSEEDVLNPVGCHTTPR